LVSRIGLQVSILVHEAPALRPRMFRFSLGLHARKGLHLQLVLKVLQLLLGRDVKRGLEILLVRDLLVVGCIPKLGLRGLQAFPPHLIRPCNLVDLFLATGLHRCELLLEFLEFQLRFVRFLEDGVVFGVC
jgi:hypothetical protein